MSPKKLWEWALIFGCIGPVISLVGWFVSSPRFLLGGPTINLISVGGLVLTAFALLSTRLRPQPRPVIVAICSFGGFCMGLFVAVAATSILLFGHAPWTPVQPPAGHHPS